MASHAIWTMLCAKSFLAWHMNMLFGLDYEHSCIVYMDDLLIFLCNADEHK